MSEVPLPACVPYRFKLFKRQFREGEEEQTFSSAQSSIDFEIPTREMGQPKSHPVYYTRVRVTVTGARGRADS
jgi:hypothetical protein